MKISAVMVAIIIFSAVGVCTGEVYHYKDGKGEIHYVDDASKVPKAYRNQLKEVDPQGNLNVMDPSPVRAESTAKEPARPRQESARSKTDAGVEVFMTSWCGYCRKMIAFLKEKGIPFTAHDIEKDSDAARTFHNLGGSGVPLVRVGSHVVYGYNPDAVMEYYRESK